MLELENSGEYECKLINSSSRFVGHIENLYDDQKELLHKTIEVLENKLKEINEDKKRLLELISTLTRK